MSAAWAGLEKIFGWLLTASWQASVLALLVLALQWALGSRLNPRWRYALWLLVLVRLLMPFQVESAFSIFRFTPVAPVALTAPITQPIFPAAPPGESSSTAIASAPAAAPSLSPFGILALLWLAGVAGLGGLTVEANRRFARHVAASPELTDPAITQLFAAARTDLKIWRTVRLVESSHVSSPAIMGLFGSTLILPMRAQANFDDQELRLIFLHELAHLKRGDVIVQGLIALLQILHWFNPLLWFAFRRMRADREPAADALVLSQTGEAEKERYGLMLLKLLEHFHHRHSLPTLVGILEDTDPFKRRFQLIARSTRGAYGWSLLGVLCLCALSALGLTAKSTTPGTNSQPGIRMSEAEAAAKGIGAIVNGQPIYWDKLAPDDHQISFLLSNYHGDALKQQLAQERYFRRDTQIDRELILDCAEREGYRTPQSILDDRIRYGINGFHGDQAAFVENLRKNGQTVQQFNEFNRDTDVVSHEDSVHVEAPVQKFIRERFPSIDFTKQRPTQDQDEIIQAEQERIQQDWMKTLRAAADIQLFDDPEYPGARPPDFISTSAPATTSSSNPQPATKTTPVFSTSDSNAPLSTAAQTPTVQITITRVEIDRKDYEQHAQAMDEAVRTGNLAFFKDRYTRSFPIQISQRKKAWFSSGEIQSYIDSVTKENDHGTLRISLQSKAIFYGLGADFTWGANARIDSNWQVTAPLSLDKLAVNPDIPKSAYPGGLRVPRLLLTSFTDKDWDMESGRPHGFWVGETQGWIRALAAGGSLEERIKRETPSRLAIFLTAQPVAASDSEPAGQKATTTPASGALLPPSGLSEAKIKAVENSRTQLLKAVHDRNYTEARALLAQGADVNAHAESGNTALGYLIDCSANVPFPLDILKTILERAHDPNPTIYSEFSTPPYSNPAFDVSLMAADNSADADRLAEMREVVQLLLAHGARFQSATGDTRKLLEAATRGDLPAIQRLVAGGTSVRSTDANGWNPLLVSIALGHDGVADWLIDQGADVRARTRQGFEDPLAFAVRRGNDDLVEKLISHGAKADLLDGGLSWAVDRNDMRLFQDLIKAGADPRQESKSYGSSGGKSWRQIEQDALAICIDKGQTAMALTLLDKGVDPEPSNVYLNQSFAYRAVADDRPVILQALLDHGANPLLRDDYGETPLSLAQKSHPDLLPMLQAAVAKSKDAQSSVEISRTPRTASS